MEITAMICRVWHAEATAENADKYLDAALTKIIPAIEARRLPGFLHIDVLRHPLPNGKVQFVTMAWFETAEAIKAFAGEDSEAAYLPSEITAVLERYDDRAIHFEVITRRPQ
jgi:heme-degrading monooxygenase HmoA